MLLNLQKGDNHVIVHSKPMAPSTDLYVSDPGVPGMPSGDNYSSLHVHVHVGLIDLGCNTTSFGQVKQPTLLITPKPEVYVCEYYQE